MTDPAVSTLWRVVERQMLKRVLGRAQRLQKAGHAEKTEAAEIMVSVDMKTTRRTPAVM